MLGETLALMAGTLGLALLPLRSPASDRTPFDARHAFRCAGPRPGCLRGWSSLPSPPMTGSTWAMNELGGTSLLAQLQRAAGLRDHCWTVVGAALAIAWRR
jgi:hypothetical protein